MTKLQSSAPGESSSLLPEFISPLEDELEDDSIDRHHHGSASFMATVVNEAHTCMGTGCLALPFATKLGGILLHVVGIYAIAMWNVYSVQRLCKCLHLLPKDAILYEDEEEDPGESNSSESNELNDKDEADCPALELSPPPSKVPPFHRRLSSEEKLTRYDATPRLQSTTSEVLTPKVYPPPPSGTSTYSRVAWYALGPWGLVALDMLMMSLFIGVIVTFINGIRGFIRDTPFTTHSDVMDAVAIAFVIGPLSTGKDLGYLAKASTLGIVALFFSFALVAIYGLINFPFESDQSIESAPLNWLPQNGMNGISTWFGSTVFGYGVAPLTYNFLESMAKPKLMVQASYVALLSVACVYILMGVGVYVLFREAINGDILHVLPAEGWFPTLARLGMALVVCLTAPLLIVPCGQLIEGKILGTSAVSREVPWGIRAAVRMGVALLCVSISVLVPGFVSVLAMVGSGSVSTVGFVMPPMIYIRLRLMRGQWTSDLLFDCLMLLWGVLATGITTVYTFEGVISKKV